MTLFRRLATATALTAAAAAASAAYVDVRFDNPIFQGVPAPGYDVVTITYPAQVGNASSSATVAAGRFQGTATSVVGVDPSIFVDGVNDLFMYCYDVYEHIGSGWSVRYTIQLDGERARTLDFLGAVNAVLNQGAPQQDPYAWLHPQSIAVSAAVQIGIWESRYDDAGWDLASGGFRATGLDAPTAGALASFFAAIPGTAALDGRFAMTLEAAGAQDMITGDPPAVPEPAPWALTGLALAALWGTRRRRAMRCA